MNFKFNIIAGILFIIAGIIPIDLRSDQVQTITVGSGRNYYPHYIKDSNGDLSGFDIDIMNAICKEVNLKCIYQDMEWHDLIPALLRKKIDVIAAAHSITAERKNIIDFSNKYADTPMSIVIRRDLNPKTVDGVELKGLKIAAQFGTLSEKYLLKYFPNHPRRIFQPGENSKKEILAKRVDAIIDDITVINSWLHTDEGQCCKHYRILERDPDLHDEGLGFGIRKTDPELRDLINKGLHIILKNGTYDKINDKYFKFNIYGNNR